MQFWVPLCKLHILTTHHSWFDHPNYIRQLCILGINLWTWFERCARPKTQVPPRCHLVSFWGEKDLLNSSRETYVLACLRSNATCLDNTVDGKTKQRVRSVFCFLWTNFILVNRSRKLRQIHVYTAFQHHIQWRCHQTVFYLSIGFPSIAIV
jgi:hypothetical protein